MKIGYARVSSNSQDLKLQNETLIKAGCSKIFSEFISGKNNDRPQLLKALDSLREGDILTGQLHEILNVYM